MNSFERAISASLQQTRDPQPGLNFGQRQDFFPTLQQIAQTPMQVETANPFSTPPSTPMQVEQTPNPFSTPPSTPMQVEQTPNPFSTPPTTPTLTRTVSSSSIRTVDVDPTPNPPQDTFCDLAQAGSISTATLFPQSTGLRTCPIHNTCPLCSAQVAGMAQVLEEIRIILRQQFLENCKPLLTSREQLQLDETLRTGVDRTGIIRKCDAKFAEANPLNQASTTKEFSGITLQRLQGLIHKHFPAGKIPPQFYHINSTQLNPNSQPSQTQTTVTVGTWIAKQILPECKNSCSLVAFERQSGTGMSHYFNIARVGNAASPHREQIWAVDAYSAPQPGGISISFPVKVGQATLENYLTALGGPGHEIVNMSFLLTPRQARAINDLAKSQTDFLAPRSGADLLIPIMALPFGGKKKRKTKRKTRRKNSRKKPTKKSKFRKK